MPLISQRKKDKISEQIIHYLFSVSPDSKYTADIGKEIARDEEFIKTLLLDMQNKGLVVQVNKNKEGIEYSRRSRWRISPKVFDAYSIAQKNVKTF